MERIAVLVLVIAYVMGMMASEPPLQDVDAFMHEILGSRGNLMEAFSSHDFVEDETLVVRGRLEEAPLRSFNFKWIWAQKDGSLVRYPDRINGVEVDESTQRRYQERFNKSRENGRAFSGVAGLSFLFGHDFSSGRFLFAGSRNVDGKEYLEIEFIPYAAEVLEEVNYDNKELIDYELRHAVFLVDPRNRMISRLKVSFASLKFNDVEELELLPSFISERLDFFEFDDVELTLNMIESSNGNLLPDSVHAIGSKRRIGYNLRIELTKKFSDYRMMMEASK